MIRRNVFIAFVPARLAELTAAALNGALMRRLIVIQAGKFDAGRARLIAEEVRNAELLDYMRTFVHAFVLGVGVGAGKGFEHDRPRTDARPGPDGFRPGARVRDDLREVRPQEHVSAHQAEH